MFKNSKFIQKWVRQLQYRAVEFDTQSYRNWLRQVEQVNVADCEDAALQQLSRELMEQARKGAPMPEWMIPALAIVREAAHRVLGMRPYDVQVMAGMAMCDRNLVEMQTGEGKTLVAVFPAYIHALSGKGVHVLTFNDYLAQRDAEWMGPVYRFLGLTVGHVREGMSMEERRKAYAADITYVTAKEAGFDYLRGFLARSAEELVQRPFHFAVVDEADSILIDEARIPLVVAGKDAAAKVPGMEMTQWIRSLQPGIDYDTDEYRRNVFLTDQGMQRMEEMLECSNLYAEENLPLLVDIQNALHAEVLLKKDVDYIVRNGRVEIVDEFTGRVADNRQWPYGLQEAIEAKEGIVPQNQGRILTSITLQHFIGLYPGMCGMTGTAVTAAEEFLEFYRTKVVVIPTHRPCIRKDEPDVIFTHKEAKYKALVEEIQKVHATGRPILIGTCSVEESEHLAGLLEIQGVSCQVLNARNDMLEAAIVAQAGALGAVTVSTNMAGRGTDIKLGGSDERDRDRVVALGGLYVIGTNRHESRRIDNQLRGRAGRQGDPGTSRFFISLEDELMERYRLKELIPEQLYPAPQQAPLENGVIRKEILQAQRIIEGQNFDIRRTLTKYTILLEQQRRKVYQWRMNLLQDHIYSNIMATQLPERYAQLYPTAGPMGLYRAEKQILLHFINSCWTDYLDYLSYIRESIHLVNVGGKVPLDEYHKIAITSFERLLADISEQVIGALHRVHITAEGVDMEKEGLRAPSSTWTYLVDDRPEQCGINPVSMGLISTIAMWPLLLGTAFYHRFFRAPKKKVL